MHKDNYFTSQATHYYKNKYKHKGGEILLFCSENICNWRIKMDVFLINEKIENLSQNLKEIKESL